MGKHIQLRIADPCHEEWDKMTKSEKGKFCGSCQKQVIDFTGMTDAQLAAFFKKKSTETVCGRFYDDQLDRGIPVLRKRIPWVRYFFQFSLPLFLTTLKAKSQGMVKAKTVQTESCRKDLPVYGNVNPLIADIYVDQGILIKGVVVNQEGNPVPFASIERGTVGTAADSTGAFSLVLANQNEIKLKVSSVGFQSKELVLSNEQVNGKDKITIILNPGKELQEVVVNSGVNWKMGNLTGGVIIRKYYRWRSMPTKLSPNKATFKVFSNPTTPGSNISIDPGKTEAGLYTIQLINLSGQLIKQACILVRTHLFCGSRKKSKTFYESVLKKQCPFKPMSTETDEEIKCIINGSIIGRSGNTARALLQGRGTAKDAGRLWNVLEHAGDALKGDVTFSLCRSERDYRFLAQGYFLCQISSIEVEGENGEAVRLCEPVTIGLQAFCAINTISISRRSYLKTSTKV